MAVLYDPATLDLSDASVADRLRKQAKTRAVKVCARRLPRSRAAPFLAPSLALLLEQARLSKRGGCVRQVPVLFSGVASVGVKSAGFSEEVVRECGCVSALYALLACGMSTR